MSATLATESARPLKRRPLAAWFQFSLRTFFIALTVVAAALGGSITYERNRCRQGQAAAKALEEVKMSGLAAWSYFYFTWQFPSPITIDKDPKHEPRPPWLRDTLGDNSFEAICTVTLRNQDANDANLAHVGRLTGIKELQLTGGTFTDKGLAHLRGLRALESLRIDQRRVSDRGIGELAILPRLKKLSLDSTSVTGNGLARFSQLEELAISDSPITDEALASVRRMKHLKQLVCDSEK